MATLTSDQLNTLAGQFNDIAQKVFKYRQNNELTDALDQQLEQAQDQLGDQADQLANLSALETGDEAGPALAKLGDINKQISDTIGTLNDVQKIINIVAAVVEAAGSVITMNPGQIIHSVGDLAGACGFDI
jgi:hypothetical protein